MAILNKTLEVKKSTLVKKQKGLFACKEFKKGDMICEYLGEFITNKEYNKRTEEGNGGYGVTVGHRILDGKNANCVAKYANDANGTIKSKFRNNSTLYNMRGRVYIYATKRIREGEEIFCAYGKDYWDAKK